MSEIKVGTSGFQFKDWKGTIYPKGLLDKDMLPYYEQALGFNTLEVNYTYYRLPIPSTMERMVEKTSDTFDFVVRSNKDMTHDIWEDSKRKTLKDTSAVFKQFREGIQPMLDANKLGCVLIQFPSFFWPNRDNFDYITQSREHLEGVPLVIEFRNKAWVKESTFSFLRENDLGFCVVDEPQLPRLMPFFPTATSTIGYVRLHGRNRNWFNASREERYDYLYSEQELKEFTGPIQNISEDTVKTYVFFNNCHGGSAAKNGLMMERIMGIINEFSDAQSRVFT